VSEIHPRTFSPGQTVMMKHKGPGVYPDSPVTIIEKNIEASKHC
jgi:hypothetical protein